MVQMPSFHHAESGNTPYVGSEVNGSLRNGGQRFGTKIWPKLGKTLKGSNSLIFGAREACHTSLESSWQGLSGFLWRTDLAASIWPLWGKKEKTLEAPGASAPNAIASIPPGAQRYHRPLLPDLRAAMDHVKEAGKLRSKKFFVEFWNFNFTAELHLVWGFQKGTSCLVWPPKVVGLQQPLNPNCNKTYHDVPQSRAQSKYILTLLFKIQKSQNWRSAWPPRSIFYTIFRF